MNPENKLPKPSFFEAASSFILEMVLAQFGLFVGFGILISAITQLIFMITQSLPGLNFTFLNVSIFIDILLWAGFYAIASRSRIQSITCDIPSVYLRGFTALTVLVFSVLAYFVLFQHFPSNFAQYRFVFTFVVYILFGLMLGYLQIRKIGGPLGLSFKWAFVHGFLWMLVSLPVMLFEAF